MKHDAGYLRRSMAAGNKAGPELEGLLIVDKPRGPTSHDVVSEVKKALKVRKAGHLGTLDPMAEGVLVVCLGAATKIAPFVPDGDKEYVGEMTIGVETDTWDSDGEIVSRADTAHIDEDKMREALMSLVGELEIEAPPYSAIKRGGEALHRKARRGENVPPALRTMVVHEMEILNISPPLAMFRCVVGRGTYVRSLVREVGARLGVGAHLSGLRRTRSGPFYINDSLDLDEIKTRPGGSRIEEKLVPLRDALGPMKELRLGPGLKKIVENGGWIWESDIEDGIFYPDNAADPDTAKALDDRDRLIAVMARSARDMKPIWKPLRVWRRAG